MNYREFINILQKQIDALPFDRQLEFAILLCKDLAPGYQRFFDKHKWGNPYLLTDAIKVCEDTREVELEKTFIDELILQVKSIIPGLDDYDDMSASYAFNAASSVYETLMLIQDADKIHIYNIVAYYFDSFDAQVREEEALTDDELDNHPVLVDIKNYLIESTKLSVQEGN